MLGKVEICGVNTSELRVLSAEESRTLLVRAKSGDLAARDALVEGNLRLVLSVLQRFSGRGASGVCRVSARKRQNRSVSTPPIM